jgi:hypothetical protein
MMKQAIERTMMAFTLGTLLAGNSFALSLPASYRLEPRIYVERGYSGEDLFLGIMLGHGKVAEQLPEIWEEPSNAHRDAALAQVDPAVALQALDQEIAAAQTAGDQDEVLVLEAVRARVQERGLMPELDAVPFSFEVLLERLRSQDKGFFERFAREIQSGEHLRIQEALRDARALLTEVWLADGVGLLADPELHPSRFIIQWTTVYVRRAVYERTAVYKKTAIWKERFVFGWFATNSSLDDALTEEILVNAIATRFALP